MRLKLLLMCALSAGVACNSPSPTAPSQPSGGVTQTANVTTPEVAEAPTPIMVAPPITALPPTQPPPPPIGLSRPMNHGDCAWDNLGAIRCYNPTDDEWLYTAALNTLSCDRTVAKHTIAIPPRTNGYFTLPAPACGDRLQVDVYAGANEGSCANPDLTGQRVYEGDMCPEPPIIPPPPPPICVPEIIKGRWNASRPPDQSIVSKQSSLWKGMPHPEEPPPVCWERRKLTNSCDLSYEWEYRQVECEQ